jgi:hypothetical protein
VRRAKTITPLHVIVPPRGRCKHTSRPQLQHNHQQKPAAPCAGSVLARRTNNLLQVQSPIRHQLKDFWSYQSYCMPTSRKHAVWRQHTYKVRRPFYQIGRCHLSARRFAYRAESGRPRRSQRQHNTRRHLREPSAKTTITSQHRQRRY